jgi:UDP-N-acetylglucosamine--N-acetylmuramyl-(pentapeptide) pyrophosphoryl-undecaprenol N-acetylglucosamine transferase
MSGQGLIMLAAGGTGGHLFPAQALAEELTSRGLSCDLMTDERVKDYGKSFPARKTHIVKAATVSLSRPLEIPMNATKLFGAFLRARRILRAERPRLVVGFGGYPSYAPLRAASFLGLPVIVHEQNAVMGRANRALSKYAAVIAGSFPTVQNLPVASLAKYRFTGNPVRNVVLDRKSAVYPHIVADGPFNLLIFGGSQGARFFSDFFPGVMGALDRRFRNMIQVTQQCRSEDIERTRLAYAELGLAFKIEPFFVDLPQRMSQAHLVICRSGASTIAELGVVGRPAILIPLPGAIDNDQFFNAQSFTAAGAGWMFSQSNLKQTEFAAHLTNLLERPSKLRSAAQAASLLGKSDAAIELANLVEQYARVN